MLDMSTNFSKPQHTYLWNGDHINSYRGTWLIEINDLMYIKCLYYMARHKFMLSALI